MNLLKEKRQIEEDKEKLIENIELKLQQLRNQRRKLEEQEFEQNRYQQQERQKQNQKKNIIKRNAIQKITNNSSKNTHIIVNKKPQPKSSLTQQPPADPNHDYHEYLKLKSQQKQTQQKIKQLQQMYTKKRQLQAIGVFPSSNTEIQKLYKDQKIQKKLAQYDPKAKQQKQKILKQEMERIGYMLKKKKVNKKQIQEMKEHYYQNIFKDHQKRLRRYEQLLIYNKKGLKLSLIQKEQLIDIVFDTLKQFTQRIKKSLIKDFMLANQKFCSVFYITQQEIFNDLEVFQTRQEGQLTRNQFYQFIKSIEISNPILNPSMRNNTGTRNKRKGLIKNEESIGSSRVNPCNKNNIKNKQNETQQKKKTQMKSYLIKLFQYFDQKNQKLVQRQKYIIALKKGLLLDKKTNIVTKEYTNSFGEYLEKIRSNKNKKSYYMQLESRFIAWSEIEGFFQNFIKGIQVQEKDQLNKNTDQQSQISEKEVSQTSELVVQDNSLDHKSHTNQQREQIIKEGKLEDYFKQYGWQQNHRQMAPKNVFPSKLTQFDKYYHQLNQKHANQIQWNNNIRDKLSLNNNVQFKQDFNKLETYIKQFQHKN